MTEQSSEVLEVFAGFELRRYPAYRVARVTERAESAGGSAFDCLFGYFGGANAFPGQLDSAPPPRFGEGASAGVRIPLTAPVLVQPGDVEDTVTVGFILPESLLADAVPQPADPAVSITAVPEARGAAAVFFGRWTPRHFSVPAGNLQAAVHAVGLRPVGTARFALFDAPSKPWFLRRNEVILTVE